MEKERTINYGIDFSKLWEIYRLPDNDPRFTTRTGKIRNTRIADYCAAYFGIFLKPEQVRHLFRKKKRMEFKIRLEKRKRQK